jgi:hypothetical protein
MPSAYYEVLAGIADCCGSLKQEMWRFFSAVGSNPLDRPQLAVAIMEKVKVLRSKTMLAQHSSSADGVFYGHSVAYGQRDDGPSWGSDRVPVRSR